MSQNTFDFFRKTIKVDINDVTKDRKSAERLIEVIVENVGEEEVKVVNITHEFNLNARYISRDNQYFLLSNQLDVVIKEIETLVSDEVVYSVKKNINDRAEAIIQLVDEAIGHNIRSFSDFVRYCAMFFYRPIIYKGIMERFQQKLEMSKVSLVDADHANSVIEEFKKDNKLSDNFCLVLDSKLSKMNKLSEKIKSIVEDDIVLEPREKYTEQFTFIMPKHTVYKRSFHLAFKINAKTLEDKQSRLGRAYIAIDILPNEFSLCLIAGASGIIGSIFSGWASLVQQPGSIQQFHFNFDIVSSLASGVMAFVIFCVYEYVKFVQELAIPYSWRAAVFTGFGCGIFAPRIIKVISTVFGG